MADIQAEVTGLTEVERANEKLLDEIMAAVRAWAEDAAAIVERELKRIVPVRTGRLRKSIRAVEDTRRGAIRLYGAFYYHPLAARRGRDYVNEAIERGKPALRQSLENRIETVLRRFRS